MITERQLIKNLRAFNIYNRDRIEKALQVAPRKAELAIHLVPVMLHYNQPGIPCYIKCEENCGGISFFKLTEEMKTAAKHSVGDFKFLESLASRYSHKEKPVIESLLLMGSIGSAAHSAASDYDYWVVIDESGLSEKKLDSLKKKLSLIEKWAEKTGSELHFFLTDVNRVRRNDFGGANKESVGTAQAGLLKEEFYRTALHVVGKYPTWWLTPPEASDEEYNATLKTLYKSWDINPSLFVDLGNVVPITMSEIFGAALWQINKAMDSPFKSILKMALLESFIDSEGESPLLCEELKRNILNSASPLHAQDPYLLMINRLLDYYHNKKREDVVELLRKGFYNKVDVKLTAVTGTNRKCTFKEEIMLHCTDEWNWDQSTIKNLNRYKEWEFNNLLDLGGQLHSFLIETYRNLTNRLKTRREVKNLISNEDMTILGRKLFSFYGKKKAKIEPLKRASDEALRLESCTFVPTVLRSKKTIWTVYRGNVTTEIARTKVISHVELKKSMSLADITAWLVINRIVDSKTFLHLIPNPLPVSLKVIQELVKTIEDFMPYHPISSIENRYLLNDALITGFLAVVNLIANPWEKNINKITFIYRNTHGEVFCETNDVKTAQERMAEILSEADNQISEDGRSFFRVFIPRSENSAKMEKQMRNAILSNIGKKFSQRY